MALVDLTISSSQFAFERAQARVVPADWDSPQNLARGDPVRQFEATELVDGRIMSVALSGPGEFLLLLTQLTIQRLPDSRRFQVPWFATHLNLNESDIRKSSATVVVNPTGMFRVSIFNQARQPLHGRQIVLYSDPMTIQLVTDEHGAILFLGNPTQFRIDPEMAVITTEIL